MIEETTRTGALVLALLGGGFTVLGLGLLLFLPRTLPGRTGVSAGVMVLGLVLLLMLMMELRTPAAA